MGWSRSTDQAIGPSVEFVRAIPSAAIVPVFVLILGAGYGTNVTIIVLGTMWPVVLATRAAVRRMDPLLHDVSRVLRLGRMREFWSITLPSLLPSIVGGIKIMAPMTLIVTLLVEIVTGTAGIGGILVAAQQRFIADQVFGMVLVAGIIALIVSAGVEYLDSLLRFHRR